MNYKKIDLTTNTELKDNEKTVIALGDFDGVHIAHKKVLQAAAEMASVAPEVPCVWTFSSPLHKMTGTDGKVLTSDEEKLLLIKETGIKTVFIADFNSFRHMKPNEFISFLKDEFHCVGVACGFNFTFGENKIGTPDLLKKSFSRVHVEDEAVIDGTTVSSSAIRRFLSDGLPERAAAFLGYPYAVTGVVTHGNGLGREFGFPTANVTIPACKTLPKPGVYQTDCLVDGIVIPGITDVGIKPTVSQTGDMICETHLLGWNGNLYGKTVTVRFLKYLRPEIKFACKADLTAQIRADVDTVSRLSAEKEQRP